MKIGEVLPGDGAKCIALQTKIDTDTMVTMGVDEVGFFSEVYTGENYVVGSKKRSYSRVYRADTAPGLLMAAPQKYLKTLRILWEELADELVKISK